MHTEFLMGNEAIALGALAAGIHLAAGYPGTPSTEVLETVARRSRKAVHVEWSTNEKAALELAAGAAYSGARALVTMKQVGLNVAADPLMSLEYVGIKGGLVLMVADDPGPISSQTEQDTRTFAAFAKVPIFDPSTVAEAYEMIQDAFALSEKYGTPVIFRATTRIDHGYESISVKEPEDYLQLPVEGFVKDSSRWVIFPRLSQKNHALIEARNAKLSDIFSDYEKNELVMERSPRPTGKRRGIASAGISYRYALDALDEETLGEVRRLKIATPFPFPENLAKKFLTELDEVLCIEELDPVIERALTYAAGKYHLPVKIRGKLTGNIPSAGENTPAIVSGALAAFLEKEAPPAPPEISVELPNRPPVLCAGCPHRASFYAVKQAMKGKKTIFCGDIGCYTLGNAMPLDMCDTCLCMGAGINIAQGVYHLSPDTKCFAFVGDSTFFASGITGVINACYNQAEMVLVVLDNSTTAMTGHQPHPGTGRTIRGEVAHKVSIEKVLQAIGLQEVVTLDPLDLEKSAAEVKRLSDLPGVKAIIFRSPCIALEKSTLRCAVSAETCIGCQRCIRELGCPAIHLANGKAKIDGSLCTGCGLCAQVCPVHAIGGGKNV